MATYRGMDGSVTFGGGVVGEIVSWGANVTGEVIDDTALGDKWKTFKGGVGSWTGSAEAHLDYGDVNQQALVDELIAATPASEPSAAEFLMATGKKLTGNILVTAIAITAQMGNTIKVSFTFQGSGAPSITWA